MASNPSEQHGVDNFPLQSEQTASPVRSKRSPSRVWIQRPSISVAARRPSLSSIGKRASVFGSFNQHAGIFGIIRRKLSVQEETAVREVFDLFDENSDGIISNYEVSLVIQSMIGEFIFCVIINSLQIDEYFYIS